MRLFKYLIGFVILIAITTAIIHNNNQKTPPNIIIILTDDQGYKDVGFNGSKDIKARIHKKKMGFHIPNYCAKQQISNIATPS